MKRYLSAFVLLFGLLGIANAVVLTGTNNSNQNQVLRGGFFRMSAKDAITAFATGGQTSGTPLADGFNRVTTVASNNDSVLLPPCVTGIGGDTISYGNTDGMIVIVLNSATNSLNVFPQLGQGINAIAVNSPLALTTLKPALFVCSPNGIWYTIPLVPS